MTMSLPANSANTDDNLRLPDDLQWENIRMIGHNIAAEILNNIRFDVNSYDFTPELWFDRWNLPPILEGPDGSIINANELNSIVSFKPILDDLFRVCRLSGNSADSIMELFSQSRLDSTADNIEAIIGEAFDNINRYKQLQLRNAGESYHRDYMSGIDDGLARNIGKPRINGDILEELTDGDIGAVTSSIGHKIRRAAKLGLKYWNVKRYQEAPYNGQEGNYREEYAEGEQLLGERLVDRVQIQQLIRQIDVNLQRVKAEKAANKERLTDVNKAFNRMRKTLVQFEKTVSDVPVSTAITHLDRYGLNKDEMASLAQLLSVEFLRITHGDLEDVKYIDLFNAQTDLENSIMQLEHSLSEVLGISYVVAPNSNANDVWQADNSSLNLLNNRQRHLQGRMSSVAGMLSFASNELLDRIADADQTIYENKQNISGRKREVKDIDKLEKRMRAMRPFEKERILMHYFGGEIQQLRNWQASLPRALAQNRATYYNNITSINRSYLQLRADIAAFQSHTPGLSGLIELLNMELGMPPGFNIRAANDLAVFDSANSSLNSIAEDMMRLRSRYLVGQLLTPPNGGNTPPNGGNTPPNGGNTPPNGGNTPPNGGNTPPNGGNTPPNGGNIPPNGGNTPPNGGNTPPNGGNTPPSGGNTPPNGGNMPPNGGNTPPSGGNTPPNGGNTPPNGGNTPPNGGNTPPNGGNTPPNGGNTPPNGGNTPPNGGNTPPNGGNTPPNGGNTPPNGGNTPPNGVNTPPNGGNTPPNGGNRGEKGDPGKDGVDGKDATLPSNLITSEELKAQFEKFREEIKKEIGNPCPEGESCKDLLNFFKEWILKDQRDLNAILAEIRGYHAQTIKDLKRKWRKKHGGFKKTKVKDVKVVDENGKVIESTYKYTKEERDHKGRVVSSKKKVKKVRTKKNASNVEQDKSEEVSDVTPEAQINRSEDIMLDKQEELEWLNSVPKVEQADTKPNKTSDEQASAKPDKVPKEIPDLEPINDITKTKTESTAEAKQDSVLNPGVANVVEEQPNAELVRVEPQTEDEVKIDSAQLESEEVVTAEVNGKRPDAELVKVELPISAEEFENYSLDELALIVKAKLKEVFGLSDRKAELLWIVMEKWRKEDLVRYENYIRLICEHSRTLEFLFRLTINYANVFQTPKSAIKAVPVGILKESEYKKSNIIKVLDLGESKLARVASLLEQPDMRRILTQAYGHSRNLLAWLKRF